MKQLSAVLCAVTSHLGQSAKAVSFETKIFKIEAKENILIRVTVINQVILPRLFKANRAIWKLLYEIKAP